MELKTEWSLVVGATGAVGRACASALSEAGLGVVVAGRDKTSSVAVARSIESGGGLAIARSFDMRDEEEVGRQFESISGLGIVPKVFVYAAGEFGPIGPAASVSSPDWSRVMDVNFLAMVRLAAMVLPGMVKAGRGRLIYTSSAATLSKPGHGNAPYSVSKAASNRFLAHLAADLEGSPVTVHAFHPGEIKSRMWRHIKNQSAGVAGLESFSNWAHNTETSPDSLKSVGQIVVALLDDEFARRAHGQFLWAQQAGKMEPLT